MSLILLIFEMFQICTVGTLYHHDDSCNSLHDSLHFYGTSTLRYVTNDSVHESNFSRTSIHLG